MKLIKKEDNFGPSIFLEEDNKYIGFTFGGNGDLYWLIRRNEVSDASRYAQDTFTITKENYRLFRLFEILFSDIENINIFDSETEIPEHINSFKKLKQYERELEKRRKEEIDGFRIYNNSNYRELYNENTGVITWYSDEVAREVANYLKIYREDDTFTIEFNTQQDKEGYDRDFHTGYYIPVRFRNSGSRYWPFNCVFMRMYNAISELDDVKEYGHQIHIEEYLYEEEQKRLIKKNDNN